MLWFVCMHAYKYNTHACQVETSVRDWPLLLLLLLLLLLWLFLHFRLNEPMNERINVFSLLLAAQHIDPHCFEMFPGHGHRPTKPTASGKSHNKQSLHVFPKSTLIPKVLFPSCATCLAKFFPKLQCFAYAFWPAVFTSNGLQSTWTENERRHAARLCGPWALRTKPKRTPWGTQGKIRCLKWNGRG